MKKNFSFRGSTLTTNWRKRWLFLLPLVLFCLPVLKAQEMKIHPGTVVVCPAKIEVTYSKVDVPQIYPMEVSFKNAFCQIKY